MFDFEISDDLYVVKEGSEKGNIYFCGDSFYGYYSLDEFEEFLIQLSTEFFKIRKELLNGKD